MSNLDNAEGHHPRPAEVYGMSHTLRRITKAKRSTWSAITPSPTWRVLLRYLHRIGKRQQPPKVHPVFLHQTSAGQGCCYDGTTLPTSNRVVLPSIPARLAVTFATFWSLFGLYFLWVLVEDGPSIGSVVTPVAALLVASGYLLQYRIKVLVTVDGVTHRPRFRTRHIPWSEIRKVDNINRLKFEYIGFYTSKTIVEAARPSAADYQQIVELHETHRSGGGRSSSST